MSNRGINKAIIVGNVGQDPEVRYTSNGKAITQVSIATNESYKDKNTGQNIDKTQWHKIVVFGKLAEIAGEYLRKGSTVYFEGKIQTRKWQDKSGIDRYTTEIVIDPFNGVMQILSSDRNQQNTNENTQQTSQQAPDNYDQFDDDIPF